MYAKMKELDSDVDRRIGGLENDEVDQVTDKLVDRRIGGLEK